MCLKTKNHPEKSRNKKELAAKELQDTKTNKIVRIHQGEPPNVPIAV